MVERLARVAKRRQARGREEGQARAATSSVMPAAIAAVGGQPERHAGREREHQRAELRQPQLGHQPIGGRRPGAAGPARQRTPTPDSTAAAATPNDTISGVIAIIAGSNTTAPPTTVSRTRVVRIPCRRDSHDVVREQDEVGELAGHERARPRLGVRGVTPHPA